MTRQLAEDYINHRLALHGYDWKTPTVGEGYTLKMNQLAMQFEKRYTEDFGWPTV